MPCSLEGFALPYGDIPVGSWRTAPYVVIQNAGTYLDAPRFMDSNHPIENADDATAYVERLQALPAVLDGELSSFTEAYLHWKRKTKLEKEKKN